MHGFARTHTHNCYRLKLPVLIHRRNLPPATHPKCEHALESVPAQHSFSLCARKAPVAPPLSALQMQHDKLLIQLFTTVDGDRSQRCSHSQCGQAQQQWHRCGSEFKEYATSVCVRACVYMWQCACCTI